MQGWLLAGGRALTVAAVDREPAEVLVVRDLGRGAESALKALGDVPPRRTIGGQGL